MSGGGGGGRRGGGGKCHDFPTKIFCLTVPKNFAGELFSAVLQKFPVAKKFMDNGGSIKIFVENFLSHSAEKHRKGTLHCFTNFGHQKMLRVNRKIFGRTETRTWNLLLENAVVLTILLSFIFE